MVYPSTSLPLLVLFFSEATVCLAAECEPKALIRSYFEQSAVLNNKWYMLGGRALYNCSDGSSQWLPYSGLRWINQSDPDMTLYTTPVPPFVPNVSMGALWSDGIDLLYLFGGQYFNQYPNSSFLTEPPAEIDHIWSFNDKTQTWKKLDVVNPPRYRLAHGASISVPESGKAYWMGGWADSSTTTGMKERVYEQKLLEFDMKSKQFEYYDIPADLKHYKSSEDIRQQIGVPRAGGGLSWVPYGEEGVLVVLGGAQCDNNVCGKNGFHPLYVVPVFDIASKRWFAPAAISGSTDPTIERWSWPQPRGDFCMLRVSSYDEQIHAIYIWGGVTADGKLDDVWVLILPMFLWVRLYDGPHGRFGATCGIAHERFMMFSGGERDIGSNIGVLDLSGVSFIGWTGYTDGWDKLSQEAKYPNQKPWQRYVPEFSAYHLGAYLRTYTDYKRNLEAAMPSHNDIFRPIAGWIESEPDFNIILTKTPRPNPYRTVDYLTAAKAVSAALLALPFLWIWIHRLVSGLRNWWRRVRNDNKVSSSGAPQAQNLPAQALPIVGQPLRWKPITARTPYLMFLLTTTLALLTVVELLYRQSMNPAFFAEYRTMYAEESKLAPPPRELGYYPTVDTRPRIGLYAYWDGEETDKRKQRGQASRLHSADYFAWNYLPTIVTVFYGILWSQCDAQVERIEPYYHLYRSTEFDAKLAKDTVDLDYHTFWAPLRLVQAYKHRHWAPFLSSTAYIIAFAVIPNLQNKLLSLESRKGGTYDTTESWGDIERHKYGARFAIVDGTFARVIEAMLGINAVCAIGLLVIFWKRNTGLYRDPKGNEWLNELLEGRKKQDFCSSCTSEVSTKDWASTHKCWTVCTTMMDGRVKVNLNFQCAPTSQANPQTPSRRPANLKVPSWISQRARLVLSAAKDLWSSICQVFLRQAGKLVDQEQQFMLNRLPLGFFIAVMGIILCGTIWVLVHHTKAFKKKDNQLPFPPELYLVIGVLMKSIYECVDRDIRALSPFLPTRSKAASPTSAPAIPAPPARDKEEYSATPPIYIILLARLAKRNTLFFISFGSLAAEIWAIFLGTLQVSASDFGSTTYAGDLVGVIVVVLCELVMIAGLVAVFVECWSVRKRPELRTRPVTILERMLLME